MNPGDASIYDFPKYYDLVYGSDCQAEIDFLETCFEAYVPHPVKIVFEPACGTGRLLFRLAKRGYNVSGIDINSKAIDFCNRRLKKHGFADRARVADMTCFELTQSYDASFNTVNSFRHLLLPDQARDHLSCVGNHLNDGGIYVLGIHLLPAGESNCDSESWSARRGHLVVNTQMWRIDLDEKNRLETFRLQYDVYTPTSMQQVTDELRFRTYTKSQLLELIDESPFDLIATFDFGYDHREPLELNDQTEDVVLILQKNRR